MKCCLVFVMVVTFSTVKTFSQDFKCRMLKKAFENILESLVKRNYLMSVVFDSFASDETVDSTIIAFTAAIPHVVGRLDSNMEEFLLNSSAIVSLESVEALKDFNERLILPVTFSM